MKRLLPILIGLGLLAIVLVKVPLRETWVRIEGAHWGWIALSCLLILAMVWFKGVRWSYLLKMQGVAYPIWDSFLVYLSSLVWGTITPGRMGDFVKVLYLKREKGMGLGLGMSSVLVDRVFDLYILLVLGCLGLILHPMPDHPGLVRGVWFFFGILVCITFLAFHRTTGDWLMRKVFQKVLGANLKGKADQAFLDFHRGMAAFYRVSILWPAVLTVLSYTGFFGACWMMMKALDFDAGFYYMSFCVAVSNIASLLTFAGMGTREGTLIVLMGLEGVSQSQALAFSAILFLTGTLFVLAVGFLGYVAKPIRFDPAEGLDSNQAPTSRKRGRPRRK